MRKNESKNHKADQNVVTNDIIFDAYYSDPHFEHENIIKYCDRPFKDSNHMITELIRMYNEVICQDDNVLWLGDCFVNKHGKRILDSLNGKKYLLRGNHDRRISDDKFLEMGFEEIYHDSFKSYIDEYEVRFSHYPYSGFSSDKKYENLRPPLEKGVTLIHGHTHSKESITHMNTIHVGVDAWYFRPAKRSEIKELLNLINK